MKKFLITIVIILVLLTISGYVEGYYCHYTTTTPPAGAPVDYIKNNQFCKLNSIPGVIGGVLIIESFNDVVDWVSKETPAIESGELTWDETSIRISSKLILSIDDFPDEVKVSPGASFGSSDKIRGVKRSPNNKWLAIAIGGAAHDFGWVYEIGTKKLTPVIFSYGGGVRIVSWNNDHEVTFSISTPKPETTEKKIDVTHLPQYPL